MTTLTTPADSAPAPSLNGTADPGPLRAAHTPNFPPLLRQLGASLLVTTYQAGKLRTCGVCVVDLRRGEAVALLKFQSGVQEVFAVALLPRRFPDLINDDENLLESSFVVPTECLGEVAATVRGSAPE